MSINWKNSNQPKNNSQDYRDKMKNSVKKTYAYNSKKSNCNGVNIQSLKFCNRKNHKIKKFCLKSMSNLKQ